MKKILFLLLVLPFVAACSDDERDMKTDDFENILGTWTLYDTEIAFLHVPNSKFEKQIREDVINIEKNYFIFDKDSIFIYIDSENNKHNGIYGTYDGKLSMVFDNIYPKIIQPKLENGLFRCILDRSREFKDKYGKTEVEIVQVKYTYAKSK